MSDRIEAWYCVHQDTISIGDGRIIQERFCRANRPSTLGDNGCRSIKVTSEIKMKASGTSVNDAWHMVPTEDKADGFLVITNPDLIGPR